MRPATPPRAPLQNRNASTPSTRLLPRYRLKFLELKHRERRPLKPPVPGPDYPSVCQFGFLSWAGLLLERPPTTKTSPSSPFSEIQGKYREPKGNAGTTRQPQCRTTGLMRPERRSHYEREPHESRTCPLRKSL